MWAFLRTDRTAQYGTDQSNLSRWTCANAPIYKPPDLGLHPSAQSSLASRESIELIRFLREDSIGTKCTTSAGGDASQSDSADRLEEERYMFFGRNDVQSWCGVYASGGAGPKHGYRWA
jgi:hypothetical protein